MRKKTYVPRVADYFPKKYASNIKRSGGNLKYVHCYYDVDNRLREKMTDRRRRKGKTP